MKKFLKRFVWSNQSGVTLVEVMVAAAMAGGLALTIAQMMKNANVQQGRITAKSDSELLFQRINDILSSQTACDNTFAFVDTAGEITSMQSATAAAGLSLPTIIDKNGGTQFTVGTTKLGKTTLSGLKVYGLNLANNLGNIEISTSYNSEGKTVQAKKRILPMNFSGTASDITNCASSGSGEEGIWQFMSLPAVGIYYNSGSVSIGNNASVDTVGSDPAFAMGSNNTVNGEFSFASGRNNSINTLGVSSGAVGASNTISSVYSFAGGHANTINISTGSYGMSGPMASFALGRSNNITGSEAGAIGYGNTIQDRFSIAIGAANNISGLGSTAIGTWNTVSGVNANAIGQYVEANGQLSLGMGYYAKANAKGSFSFGDTSSGGVYLLNNSINHFNSRFAGGYSFYTEPVADAGYGVHITPYGNVGIGVASPTGDINGGVLKLLHIQNNNSALHSQNQIMLGTASNFAGSAIGGVSAMTTAATSTYKTVAGVGFTTGASHTATTPTGVINFATRSASDIMWLTRMLINEDGNVGIDAGSTPYAKLSVGGNPPAVNNTAIFGYSDVNGNSNGVYGKVLATNVNLWQVGVRGECSQTGADVATYCVGVKGFGGYDSAQTMGRSYGGYFEAKDGTSGWNYGVYGHIYGTNGGTAIFGTAHPSGMQYSMGSTKYAGYFDYGPVGLNPGGYGTALSLEANNMALMRAKSASITTGYIDLDNIQFRTSASVYGANIQVAGKLGVNWGSFPTAPTYDLDVTGNIRATGCIIYGGTTLGACVSDKRAKKDIHPFEMGLEELMGINPVFYKFNGLAGHENNGKEYIGVIAQELEKTNPSLVTTEKVKMNAKDSKLSEIKVVNNSSFLYIIINSVKELYKKVLALIETDKKHERDIASLKEENERLAKELKRQKEEQAEMKKMFCEQNKQASFCRAK